MAVGALSIMIMLFRSITKWRNSKCTMELILAKSTPVEASSSSEDMSDSQEGYTDVNSYPNPNKERVLVHEEKTSNWKKVFGKRMKKSSHSTGEGLICLIYVLINAAALWASPHYSLGVGFGSLSAGNTLFTFMTASRNSIFTWMVGIAFDEALVYHRFFGRLKIERCN